MVFAIVRVTGYSSEAKVAVFSCASLGWGILRINGGSRLAQRERWLEIGECHDKFNLHGY